MSIKINGIELDEMSFRDKILVEQEASGKDHLYRVIMSNYDEYGNWWKDRILYEMKGQTFNHFDNFCAEIADSYNESFDGYVNEEDVEKAIYKIIQWELDIELEDLFDEVSWLESELEYIYGDGD